MLFFILCLLITFTIRIIPYNSTFLKEPDEYVYSLIVQKSILTNNLNNPTSWTDLTVKPSFYTEKPLLILIPEYFSMITSLSVFQTFNLLGPLLFLLCFIAFYLYSNTLLENKYYALLSALIFSVVLASLFHTVAGEWRGEELTITFMLFDLLLINKIFSSTIFKRIEFILLFLTMTFLYFSWNGAIFSLLILMYTIFIFVFWNISTKIFKKDWNFFFPIITTITIILGVLVVFIFFKNYQIGSLSVISETTSPSILFLLASTGFLIIPLLFIFLILCRKTIRLPKTPTEYSFMILALACIFLGLQQERFIIFLMIPLAILITMCIKIAFSGQNKTAKTFSKYFLILVLPSIILYSFFFSFSLQPADNINTNFYSALYYLKNNTSANATVMSLWPDGSVIENIAQRRVYSDSMAGGLDLPQFAQFLYAKYGNFTYLYQMNVSYLLVRRYWLLENQTILSYIHTNISFNNTNFYHLVVLNESNNNLSVFFKNNDSTIYEVKK